MNTNLLKITFLFLGISLISCNDDSEDEGLKTLSHISMSGFVSDDEAIISAYAGFVDATYEWSISPSAPFFSEENNNSIRIPDLNDGIYIVKTKGTNENSLTVEEEFVFNYYTGDEVMVFIPSIAGGETDLLFNTNIKLPAESDTQVDWGDGTTSYAVEIDENGYIGNLPHTYPTLEEDKWYTITLKSRYRSIYYQNSISVRVYGQSK